MSSTLYADEVNESRVQLIMSHDGFEWQLQKEGFRSPFCKGSQYAAVKAASMPPDCLASDDTTRIASPAQRRPNSDLAADSVSELDHDVTCG